MKTAVKTLIVTADDFGLSEKVNEGILEAFHRGVVRNTTLMVNFPDLDGSVACLKQAKGLDVGVHLNLTSGSPVIGSDRARSLVDRQGRFLGLVPFFKRVAVGRIRWAEVEQEWSAQIELGNKMGFRFSSITSHQHVHMLPRLARIAAELAQQYDIPVVRLSRYHWASRVRPLRPKSWILAAFAGAVRGIIDQHRKLCNDFALDIPPLAAGPSLARLSNTLRRLPDGLYELVCHPGYVDRTLESRDHYTIERLIELDVLTAAPLRDLLADNGIELTTFRRLASATLETGPEEGAPRAPEQSGAHTPVNQ